VFLRAAQDQHGAVIVLHGGEFLDFAEERGRERAGLERVASIQKLRQAAQAIFIVCRVERFRQPVRYNALIPLTLSLEKLGRVADAERLRRRVIEALENQLRQFPDDVRARILLGNFLATFGQADEAVRHVRIAVAMRPSEPNVLYNAACTYGLLQMKKEALDTFRRCLEAGYSNADWCTKDPDLKILHDDPEFKRLIAEQSGREK
jgi:tetratricopeptide (TPR) repeat protein